MTWDNYEEFSSEFLAKYHDYVLYDVAHRIKAFLLYPPTCSCANVCQCELMRNKIILSLNMDLMNQAQERQIPLYQLNAMKMIFKIPDDNYFKANYANGFPVWLIHERLNHEDTKKNFKIVEGLVWGLLRLARTYELSGFKEPRASINEAVDMILGGTPLKTRAKKLDREPAFFGEKGYGVQLNIYKSVCHFIVAFIYMVKNDSTFSLSQSKQIHRFLSLSKCFRAKLFSLKTPNIKDNSLFSEKTLVQLPNWVNSDGVEICIDPFEVKLQQINAQIYRVNK